MIPVPGSYTVADTPIFVTLLLLLWSFLRKRIKDGGIQSQSIFDAYCISHERMSWYKYVLILWDL